MAIFITLEVVITVLREGIQIDRLLVACEKPRGTGAFAGKLFFNRLPSDGGTRSGFRFRYHGSSNKTNRSTCLWLVNTQFSYTGAQGAAVEPKNFCSPVFATHFPIGLLKYPDHMVAFDFFQRFLGGR